MTPDTEPELLLLPKSELIEGDEEGERRRS